MQYEVFNQQAGAATMKTFSNLRAAKRHARSIAGAGFDNGGVVRDAGYKSRAAIYNAGQGWDFTRCPESWAHA